MDNLVFRPIQQADNEAIATIVRNTLMEFGAAKPGTVYADPTLNYTYEEYQKKGCAYFVIELEGKIVGGGGIYATNGLPEAVVELSRVYLLPETRGKGIGKKIIEFCENLAKQMGYEQMYLESLTELSIAVPLYEKLGYQHLTAPLGDSGHFACEIRMIKNLT